MMTSKRIENNGGLVVFGAGVGAGVAPTIGLFIEGHYAIGFIGR